MIPRRFNGPPDSGHGGYSAGLAASLVDGPAEVALRAPPPLEQELTAERRPDGSVAVSSGDVLVMEARPTRVELAPPDPVEPSDARRVDPADFLEGHPFPTCFACGPERAREDGLRLFPGAVPGRELFAVAWTPAAEFGTDGATDPLFVWAALDCPSCAPARGPAPIVLASLAVDIRRPVPLEEPHVVGAWEVRREGRKRFTGVALWDSEGTVLARGRALWIELRRPA